MKKQVIVCPALLTALFATFAGAPFTRADVFQWEYIDPANPSLGRQQSTILAPDGAGANAAPGENLSNRNLIKAYLVGAELYETPIWGGEFGNEIIGYLPANLAATNLSHADLTNANLSGAALSAATSLAGAVVRGTNLYNEYGSGISAAQLYSTASYQTQVLTGIGLGGNNWTGANFIGQNLVNAGFNIANLSGANLSQADLTGASFWSANLINANLTGAEVRGAEFYNEDGTGITPAQLYSTASYQVRDLTGIKLAGNNLEGANLAGQNLTSAIAYGASFVTADFSQGNLANANFLRANLTGANLSQANLTNAYLGESILTGAILTGAEVRGANLRYSGITPAQLYSTASYGASDLTGIELGGSLEGFNLSGQNLTDASFSGYLNNAAFTEATLTNAKFDGVVLNGANLRHANLTNAFISGATMTNVDLTGADARGVVGLDLPPSAIANNLIKPDGHVAGLGLTSSASLVIRDYDGNPAASPPVGPLPIVVDQQFTMNAAGALRMEFDADSWDSTISFASDVPVTRGGALELAFAAGVNPAAQVGRTFDLFNWNEVNPTGAFNVSSEYAWDLTKLYTTGEVTLTGAGTVLPGDFNGDSLVDAADLAEWKADFGVNDSSDADGDGDTDGADFLAWQRQLGATASVASTAETVPEPTGALLVALSMLAYRRRRTPHAGTSRNGVDEIHIGREFGDARRAPPASCL